MEKIMTAMWIDGGENLSVGEIGFLVRISNPERRSERHELRDRPPYTNISHQPTPRGWCGSYNGTSTSGCGVWKVTRIAKNGRAQIVEVTDRDALVAFLDEYGFPELLDECLPANA